MVQGMAKTNQGKGKASAKAEEVRYSLSDFELKSVYTAEDLKGWDYKRDLADPGQFPYTRGIHENMYLGKLWTMRQFAGFGGPEETNARFKLLLEGGQIAPIAYEDVEHVRITRAFLDDPSSFLRRL